MAYNVLKGVVDGSVDQHANQEIEGVKVFKSTISASVFYDTDAEAPCVTAADVAITSVDGSPGNAVLTYHGDKKARAHHALTFDGKELITKQVRAHHFVGGGAGIRDIQARHVQGVFTADQIRHGVGLDNVRDTLQIKSAPGLVVDSDGIGIRLNRKGALGFKSNNLVIDLTQCTPITHGGQNLSDDDLFVVADTSRGSVHNTTLVNFYKNYIHPKVPHAAGRPNEIQLKGKGEFDSSANLSYDPSRNVLSIGGKTQTVDLEVENKLVCAGAVVKPVKKIESATYEVEENDYTLVCDTVDSRVVVILPPACNHTGRILNIKKANSKKYKINSLPVVIKTLEGQIDLTDTIELKMNYSSRTVQSDGANWWVIGTKGS